MGLIVAAGIVTLCVLFAAALILSRSAAPQRPALLAAFLIMLPLQPLAYYLLRVPADVFIRAGIGTGLAWTIVALFYAPLTEEPAKWLALAWPRVRNALTPANAVPLSLMIGLGFAIGEIWFLGHAFVSSPSYADAPFWMFNGFVLERLEVGLLHGVFVAPVVARLALGKSLWPAALLGIALHFITNAPIALMQADYLSLGPALWTAILSLWVLVLTALGGIALMLMHQWMKKHPA